jgi:hypothetical protein
MVVRAGDRVDELARAVCEGRDRATLEQACESIDRAVVAATTETDSGETPLLCFLLTLSHLSPSRRLVPHLYRVVGIGCWACGQCYFSFDQVTVSRVDQRWPTVANCCFSRV